MDKFRGQGEINLYHLFRDWSLRKLCYFLWHSPCVCHSTVIQFMPLVTMRTKSFHFNKKSQSKNHPVLIRDCSLRPVFRGQRSKSHDENAIEETMRLLHSKDQLNKKRMIPTQTLKEKLSQYHKQVQSRLTLVKMKEQLKWKRVKTV